jgi:MtN3 and saliva related transmembrane protein
MQINPDTVAYIAAFFTTLGYVPQAIKTIKTKDTKAISFWMYLLSLIGVIFWLIFGLMISNYPIILKNVLLIILGGIILAIKTIHIFRDGEDIKNYKFFKKRFRKRS